jgi:hypothetical protein
VVAHHVLDRALAAGVLVRVHPRVFVLADHVGDDDVLDRAAWAYAGPGAALSHTTALRRWGIQHVPRDGRRHVTVAGHVRCRGDDSLVVHRRQRFPNDASIAWRAGLPVVALEQALVESWAVLEPSERLGPFFVAVRERRTTPQRIFATFLEQPRTEGAAEIAALCDLMDEGCRSELELFGHRRVFDSESLPSAVLQHPVATALGTFFLDRAYLAERVGVELDGAAYHGDSAQREHDVRRDAALAAVGWLIVRFTYRRLHADPEGCRRELAEILESRRRQLSS